MPPSYLECVIISFTWVCHLAGLAHHRPSGNICGGKPSGKTKGERSQRPSPAWELPGTVAGQECGTNAGLPPSPVPISPAGSRPGRGQGPVLGAVTRMSYKGLPCTQPLCGWFSYSEPAASRQTSSTADGSAPKSPSGSGAQQGGGQAGHPSSIFQTPKCHLLPVKCRRDSVRVRGQDSQRDLPVLRTSGLPSCSQPPLCCHL